MKVYVKFPGPIGTGTGYTEKEFDVPQGTTVRELLDMMKLQKKSSNVTASVNGFMRDKATVLKENDKVLILPIVGGG
jgi:molybdopterin converting factor small subunit